MAPSRLQTYIRALAATLALVAPMVLGSGNAAMAIDGEDLAPAIVREARLAGDARRTRLVLDIDRATEFRIFTLANPSRVVLDLSNVQFTLRSDEAPAGRGLISAYRFGVFAPGKARMVLEVTGPVAIDKAFLLDAIDDQPARLVVDLVKSDPVAFARSTASVSEQRAASAPATTPAPSTTVATEDGRPVVVLDPGHGGLDSGTTGYSAFTEKTIVLETALALRDKLERSGLVRVVLTRSTDTFVPLGERVRIARANRADLFVSLHADALARGDGQARGASVYTLSDTASDADAARLAESENKADLIAGVDLSDESDEVAGILVDLAQRETRSFSAQAAHGLVGNMKGAVRMHRTPLKAASFRVLRAHDVPSVLVELGYMSSPEDRKDLTSEAWRDRVTEAMAQAITRFFAARGALATQQAGGEPAAR